MPGRMIRRTLRRSARRGTYRRRRRGGVFGILMLIRMISRLFRSRRY